MKLLSNRAHLPHILIFSEVWAWFRKLLEVVCTLKSGKVGVFSSRGPIHCLLPLLSPFWSVLFHVMSIGSKWFLMYYMLNIRITQAPLKKNWTILQKRVQFRVNLQGWVSLRNGDGGGKNACQEDLWSKSKKEQRKLVMTEGTKACCLWAATAVSWKSQPATVYRILAALTAWLILLLIHPLTQQMISQNTKDKMQIFSLSCIVSCSVVFCTP